MTLDAPSKQADLTATGEPFALFAAWLAEAERSEPNDPNAMALATVDGRACPMSAWCCSRVSIRAGSSSTPISRARKGGELLGSGKAALCFHWKSLRRQVRVGGPVEAVTDAEADAYFGSRPRDSRIGAWASQAVAPARKPLRAGEGGGRYAAKLRASARCRGRPTGRVSGCSRCRSSSGTTGRSACMRG